MRVIVDLPDGVRRKALAVGDEGRRWLDELGQTVADLEDEWQVRVGHPIGGGSGGYVAHAVAADGTETVLKVSIPDGLVGHTPFDQELESLRLGAGHGYVRVLRSDLARRAMLQERLGRPLSALGLPVESQIEIIAATLRRGWRRPPPAMSLRTGAEQAQFLREDIDATWNDHGQPCSRGTVQRALEYAAARQAAFDPQTSVLIHGDGHPANILEDPSNRGSPGAFKLIDPDGMLSEPAHDLAIPLRDWTDELLAGHAAERGLAWCARLSAVGGVDARAIWEWAFVERVSTGLFLMRLGDPLGERFLRVAELWTDAQP
jgi:streptomycin 6-kinase